MQCPDTNRLIRYLLVKLAPVILGVKPAGLLRLTDCRQTGGKQHDLFCLHQPEILAALQLRCRILRRNNENLVVFFFREGALERVLSEPHNAEFLAGRGYRRGAELAELEFRCRNGSGFPHEIGVFLGYPLKDVRGYIENPDACLALPRGLWRWPGNRPNRWRSWNGSAARKAPCAKSSAAAARWKKRYAIFTTFFRPHSPEEPNIRSYS